MESLAKRGSTRSTRYGLRLAAIAVLGMVGCATPKAESNAPPIIITFSVKKPPTYKIPEYKREFKRRVITYPNSKIKRAHDASVQIMAYQEIKKEGKKTLSRISGLGTGVVHINYAKKEVWVWTMLHVIDDHENLAIMFKDSAFSEDAYVYKAKVVAAAPSLDLALMKVEAKTDEQILNLTSVDFYKDELPPIAAPVFHFGNFNARHMDGVENYTEGNISRYLDGEDESPRIETTSKTYFGSSGGGLFLSKNGECLGLASTITRSGLGMYVPYYEIRAWAKAAGYEEAIN